MTTLAVVGVGGWGRNLVRTYHQLPGAHLKLICDLDGERAEEVRRQFPGPQVTTRVEDVLADPAVDAVVVASSARSHYPLGRAALEAGKDVYLEKPFVLEVAHAEALIALARERERVLMVGHLLEYHPVVRHLKGMIARRELGDIYYAYSQRVNLGVIRNDESALWNFAPHDVSTILHLLGGEPTVVAAQGRSYVQRGIEDVVFLTLHFADGAMAHIHVSWLDPHKIRRLTLVGSRRMAVFDDVETREKLRVYDKGADWSTDYNTFAEYVTLRSGDVTVPYVRMDEPLRLECQHFLDRVRDRQPPLSDGADGLRVVRVLAAAERSLARGGAPVALGDEG